jgi:hypothetical protein
MSNDSDEAIGSPGMSRQDVIYLSPADHPHEGLPIGNGTLGAMFWTPVDGYEFVINHTEIFDDQPDGHFDGWAANAEENWTTSRGAGTLKISAEVPLHDRSYLKDFEARLDLGKAQTLCRSSAPFADVECQAWVSREAQVGVIRCCGKTDEPLSWRINLSRWGSRTFGHWYAQIKTDPSLGLQGTSSGSNGKTLWIQQKLREMDFVLAVRVEGASGVAASEHSRSVSWRTEAGTELDVIAYYTVVTSEEAADPLQEAQRRLDRVASVGSEALFHQHSTWWSNFWSKSYIHLSEEYLENLWYLHLYYMASCNGGRHPARFIDALWPVNRDFRAWTHFYQWNQQELYWCLGPAGHVELTRSYFEWRLRTLPQAIDYAKQRGVISGAFFTDVGNRRGWQDRRDCVATNRAPGLLISLEAWRYYQYSGDRAFLRDCAWPLLLETARFQLAFLERGADDKLHVGVSTPYEDDSGYFLTRDCITDLSLIRASFAALIDAAQLLDLTCEIAPFAAVLKDLTEFTLIDLPEIYIKRSDGGLWFNRDWPDLPDYPVRPPFGPVGLGDAEKIESTKVFSIGFLQPEGGRTFTWKDATRPLEGKYLMRGTHEAPVFPAGLVGLKDRGTDRFAAAVTAAKGNWTPSHGHALLPTALARLGLRDHLRKYLMDMPSLYQHFPQGFFTYACTNSQYDAIGSAEPYYARDCDRPDETSRRALRREAFVHFGFEAAGTFAAALTESLLQSYDGVIRVFPALPAPWQASFRLRAINGFWVEAEADAQGLRSLKIESEWGGRCRVDAVLLGSAKGQIGVLDAQGNRIAFELMRDELSFSTACGEVYQIVTDLMDSRVSVSHCGLRKNLVKQCGNAILGKLRDF